MTTWLSDILDVDLLKRHVADGNISAQTHPTEGGLTIYNYTKACQFNKAWDDVTRLCRGLIVNAGMVWARPFPKFYNLGEHSADSYAGELNLKAPIRVYDKADGSLGISYIEPSTGRLAWATRGSFTSDQAQWATKTWTDELNRRGVGFVSAGLDRTILVEIIYPSNRIVLDYGDYQGLTLLAVIDNATGMQVGPPVGLADWPWRTVDYFGAHDAIPDLSERPDSEGYVLLSGDGETRVKIKTDEYVRLHKILTNVSAKSIWEMLSAGEDLSTIIEGVPDEFYDWVHHTDQTIRLNYDLIMTQVQAKLLEVEELPTRKDQAAALVGFKYAGLVFGLLDGKNIADRIWKLVKPAYEKPFTVDPDRVDP